MKKYFTLLAVLLLSSCGSSPIRYLDSTLVPHDEHTGYTIESRDDGFDIEVYYGRYQYFPESAVIVDACKSNLIFLANEHAKINQKTIVPINEQGIRISTGRNEWNGITSCSAVTTVTWN
jgi:hypothetical protein